MNETPFRFDWRGPITEFLEDTTAEISLEGALSSGKTWACLWKELQYAHDYPGLWSFAFRYSDDATKTKLKPMLEQLCLLRGEEVPHFESKELYYNFPNGSRIYTFGLKAVDYLSRYSKLRGLGVSRIYCDQAEELPGDIALELRARLRQPGYPHQLTFSPNPPNVTHWLAKEFPESNSKPGRRYYAIAIYDNAHNLPPETIPQLEAAFPPEHAKHKSVILGRRGVNVMGDPVYGHTFMRRLHVRPLTVREEAPIDEAFEFGKHHPVWVCAQRFYTGGLGFLGGIIGQNLFLEDFLPLVARSRRDWFPKAKFRTCCSPQGETHEQWGDRYTMLQLLRDAGYRPVWQEHANALDVTLAMIERLAGYMRRRTVDGEEAFAIHNDPARWLRASHEGIEACFFLDEAFEAGYEWDEHFGSIGNKELRRPKEDGWFELGMRAAENLELNFGARSLSEFDRDQREAQRKERAQYVTPLATGPNAWMG